MKKILETIRRGVIGLFLISFFASVGFGSTGNIKIQPYITIQEEYSDNINLTSKSPKSDFITTLYPGIKINTNESLYGIDLDYNVGLVFYAATPEYNYVNHTGKLTTFIRLTPRWTLRLKDDFLRSAENRTGELGTADFQNQTAYSTNQGRAIFSRNVFEPVIEYQFGKEDRLALTYRNLMYRTQNPLSQDSQENALKANVTYWLTIKNGISLDYTFSKGSFERSPDLRSHFTKLRYTYRSNPTTSFFGEYSFLRNDFQTSGMDYSVHNPIFGFEHAFSSALSSNAQVGYFWRKAEDGASTGFTYQAGLTRKDKKTTYNLTLQGGYTEDYFSAGNFGFIRNHRAVGKVTHRLQERFVLGFSGSIERAEFNQNRMDWIWGLTGNASYQILEWLTLNLEVSHRENYSNNDLYSFGENRALLKITGTY